MEPGGRRTTWSRVERAWKRAQLRLLLAELELVVGDIDRPIAVAGMAIQLAPDDLLGMTLLLRAQARSELQAS